jgi:hypothetical protein
MTEKLEHELRQLFAADAEYAPAVSGLAENVRRRVHRRNQSRFTWGAGLLVAAAVTGFAVTGGSFLNDPSTGDQRAAPSINAVTSGRPGGQASGALRSTGGESCVMRYTPRNMATLAIAFDGTVTSIGEGHSDRSGVSLGLVGTTFTVNEWFAGGSGKTVTIDMPPPGGNVATGELPPAYEVGSRLLVSGAHRWNGATMDDAVAWGCGFTRYYDQATADEWRAATR